MLLKNINIAYGLSLNRLINSEKKRLIKEKAVKFKGGKCQRCGYRKCYAALSFHHKDPELKEFSIGSGVINWNRIKKELKKCILLCNNCHAEIHYNNEKEFLI